MKQEIRRCTLWSRLEGLPYKALFCRQLPEYRVDDDPSFSNVRLDFAGPLIVSDIFDRKYDRFPRYTHLDPSPFSSSVKGWNISNKYFSDTKHGASSLKGHLLESKLLKY